MDNDLLGRLVSRIAGVIITTFIIASMYGLALTTTDFVRSGYNPEASGHKAADHVYGIFNTVSNEIQRNETEKPVQVVTALHRVAVPYAVTADLSAIFAGKLEIGVSSFFHAIDKRPNTST
jgi:hypothetical protein